MTFWRLWTSSGLSNLADGVLKVALPLVAIQFTRSPTLIAGLTVTVSLPWLLFALPAGVLADRLDRRHAMVGANLVRAAVLTLLASAVLLDLGSLWLLYAAALAIGMAETLYDTSAQSILPQMVPRDRLSRANGRLYAAELTANEFAGPPLAGLLVAVGAAVTFLAPAALWVVAVAVLLTIRGRFRVERPARTTMRHDIAEGLRFLWHNKVLRTLAMLTGAANFTVNAMMAVFVLYAVGPGSAIGLTGPAFGLLLATVAIGSLSGSLIAEWVERTIGKTLTLGLAVLGMATAVGTPALTANPFVIGVVFFISGFSSVTWNVIVVSMRQRITPDRLLGRVNSGYRLVAWGALPLGAAAGGLLAQWFGLRVVFASMSVLLLVALAAAAYGRGFRDQDLS